MTAEEWMTYMLLGGVLMKSMEITIRYGDRQTSETGDVLWSPDSQEVKYLIISRAIDAEEAQFAVTKLIQKLNVENA